MGIQGTAIDWLMKVKGLTYGESIVVLEKFEKLDRTSQTPLRSLPDSPIYQNLLDIFFDLGKTYRDYWYKRGYNDETIDHFKLGYTGKCYVIPIIFQGVLYNFQCRTPEKRMWGWTRGLGVLPFNFDILQESETVIITESPVNAIAMYQYGYNSVSQNAGAGTWLPWWNIYFNHVKQIIVAYDHDIAGYHGAEKVANIFRDRSRVLVWPYGTKETYDLNDMLKDNKPKEEVVGLLLNNCYSVEQLRIFKYLRKE